MLYNIIFKTGSNRIEFFDNIKDFGKWWRTCVYLGIYKPGTVISVSPLRKDV